MTAPQSAALTPFVYLLTEQRGEGIDPVAYATLADAQQGAEQRGGGWVQHPLPDEIAAGFSAEPVWWEREGDEDDERQPDMIERLQVFGSTPGTVAAQASPAERAALNLLAEVAADWADDHNIDEQDADQRLAIYEALDLLGMDR